MPSAGMELRHTVLSRRKITAALIGLLILVVGGWLIQEVLATGGSPAGGGAPAATDSAAVPGADSGLRVVGMSTLPDEAVAIAELIEDGGPFPYPGKDGSVFHNREGLLPSEETGYYREYTLPTPGSSDRGARRFVTGDEDELFYTPDHYRSFVVVDPAG